MAKLDVNSKMIDFNFDTPWEDNLNFYEEAKKADKKFVIVKFLRYLGCRNCQLDIIDLESNYSQLEAAGAQLFVVLQSAKETLQNAYPEDKPPFTYILDPEMKLYKELEIGDQIDKSLLSEELLAKRAANSEKMKVLGLVHGAYEGNEQQAPATFIMDKEMNVLYSRYGVTSVDTPTVEEIVEFLADK